MSLSLSAAAAVFAVASVHLAAPIADAQCGWRASASALYSTLADATDDRAAQLRELLSNAGVGGPDFSSSGCAPADGLPTTPPQPAPGSGSGGSVAGGPVAADPSAGSADAVPLATGTGSTTRVASSAELQQAITAARPGDTIQLAPGAYSPLVISNVSGTAQAPITLTGPADAVIDGGATSGGYALHLDGASFWQLTGFSVTGGGKGVVVDGGGHNVLDSLDVGRTGDEAVHFRANSSDNSLQRSTIHDTGLAQPQYGEGAYIGSAKSNWKKISGGQPDLSMRNRIVDNTFTAITAENVDVKEETSGALIGGNRFDGSATSGKNYADSIIDIKGYDSTVRGNVTTGSSPVLKNIIETHVITDPATSGCGNTITDNTVQGFQPTGALVAVDKKCGDTTTTTGTTAGAGGGAAAGTNADDSQEQD